MAAGARPAAVPHSRPVKRDHPIRFTAAAKLPQWRFALSSRSPRARAAPRDSKALRSSPPHTSLPLRVPENAVFVARPQIFTAATKRSVSTRYGPGISSPCRRRAKTGTPHLCRVHYTIPPFHDEASRVVGIAAILRDVTKRFEEMRGLSKELAARQNPEHERGTGPRVEQKTSWGSLTSAPIPAEQKSAHMATLQPVAYIAGLRAGTRCY